jgi:hypothetical protein
MIIGDSSIFAIELEITNTVPKVVGKSRLWINNSPIGDFEDENILWPFFNSIRRIINNSNSLWFDEFDGKNCVEIFYTIHPFYGNPDDFWNLTSDKQKRLDKYDIFYFFWGENFDRYIINTVIRNDVCQFSWTSGTKEVDIACFSIQMAIIRDCYKVMIELFPNILPKKDN